MSFELQEFFLNVLFLLFAVLNTSFLHIALHNDEIFRIASSLRSLSLQILTIQERIYDLSALLPYSSTGSIRMVMLSVSTICGICSLATGSTSDI